MYIYGIEYYYWLSLVLEMSAPMCSSVDGDSTNSTIYNAIFAVKVGSSSLSCLLNVIAIVVIFVGGNYKKLAVRLVLYFLIANFLLVVTKTLQIVPVKYENETVRVREDCFWHGACCTVAFLAQVTVWMRNFVFVFIMFHIFSMVRDPASFWQQQYRKIDSGEVLGVCICFFLPFTFNWIPFLDDYYGLSGHWCWIKSKGEFEGILFMSALYFGPLLVIVLVTSLFSIYVLCKWCLSADKHRDIVLVILYPILFNILYILITYNRLYSTIHHRDNNQGAIVHWVLHAIGDSGITILPPACVILMLFCRTSRNMLLPRIVGQAPTSDRGAEEVENLVN